jgi:hypothetical protein
MLDWFNIRKGVRTNKNVSLHHEKEFAETAPYKSGTPTQSIRPMGTPNKDECEWIQNTHAKHQTNETTRQG